MCAPALRCASLVREQLPLLMQRACTQCCVLYPCSFFVAWNGVLTLVYEGFPAPLARLKSHLNEPHLHVKPENSGSKWPKTTMGALIDDAPEFSLDELRQLHHLCMQHSQVLSSLGVPVFRLSVVTYAARGLEAQGRQHVDHVPIRPAPPVDEGADDGYDLSECTEEESQRVKSVLSEWDDLAAYLPRVNQPGSRISSYREASPSGSTLVTFIAPPPPDGNYSLEPDGDYCLQRVTQLQTVLQGFRAAVDALFPGRYAWLEQESLHVTLRALD